MILKKFNRQQCSRRFHNPRKPHVTIACWGVILFNNGASELFGFKPGDRVNFYQDEARPKDWYIEKTEDTDGLQVRMCKTGFACSTSEITREMLKPFDLKGKKSITFPIALSPDENGYYAILTSVVK